MVGQCICNKFAGETKLGGEAHMPNGPCSEILNTLQKQEHGNFMKFQQRERSPTSGEEYQIDHIPVQTHGQLVGKHFCRKRTQDSFWKS